MPTRVMPARVLAACAGLAVLLGSSAGAFAQESLPQALDRAGNAANRALGEMLGVRPAKPPAKRKPVARQGTKPDAKPDAAPKQADPVPKPPDTAAKIDSPKSDSPKSDSPKSDSPKSATAKSGKAAGPAASVDVPLPPEPPVSRAATLAPKQEPAAAPNPRPAPLTAPAPPVASKEVIPAPAPVAPPVPRQTGSQKSSAAPKPSLVPPPAPQPAPVVEVAPPQRTALAIVPLPPPRPALATPVALPPPSAPAEPAAPAAAPPEEPAPASGIATGCAELAEAGIATFAVADPPAAMGACGIERPVRLAAVRLTGGQLVPLEPAALLRCDMAFAVARWIREEVAPTVATLGSPLDKVMVAASYDCRPRNRVSGAKMSEHGRGNAMDTRGYKLEDGRIVEIGGKGKEAMPVAFQERLKASACGRFKTILGPGSDGYHEEHLHVDLQPRRSNTALCHWAVRDMDAPKPAPATDPKSSSEDAAKTDGSAAAGDTAPDAKPAPPAAAPAADAKPAAASKPNARAASSGKPKSASAKPDAAKPPQAKPPSVKPRPAPAAGQ
ncbi:hypothetical protein G3545_16945 [Starkeya sp. ORNL1]|uniref:extensin family protein n=1 Tax=Starkeya sp. ORNL1 TaxID=2709380 RepID=UPI001463D537|nr:extensin family protein [Starkeya sp. ORNL1]QJP15189.1 hypothetical protein G3545_16945 [Starkeya sp. ORNL1]